MNRWGSRLAAVGCAVVAVQALTGCGTTSATSGATTPAVTSPTQIVLDAATRTEAARSAHMVMTSTVLLGGHVVAKVEASGDMAFDESAGRVDLTMTVMGKDVPMQEIVSHKVVYLKSALTGPKWLKLKGAFSGTGSTNPTDSLAMLQKMGSITEVGSDTLDGVATTHFTGTVDVMEALSKSGLSAQMVAQIRKSLGSAAVKPAQIGVWVDSAGRVAKAEDAFSLTIAGQTMRTLADVQLSDFGETVNVTAPPASDVASAPAGLFGGS